MSQHSDSSPKKRKRFTRSSLRSAFVDILWPRRKLVVLGLCLILVSRAASLVMPGAVKYIIDDVITAGDLSVLKWILLAIGGAVLVQALTGFALVQLLSVEAQYLIKELRVKVQKHVMHLPLAHFDSTKSGELVSRVMSDAEGVRNLIGTGLVQLVGGVLTAVASFVILLRIHVPLTLVALIPAGLFAVISTKAFKTIRPVFRERHKIRAEVTGRLTESLGGIRVVKGFHAEGREEAVFEDGAQRLFENVKKTLLTTSFVNALATALMGVATLSILGLGAQAITEGEMSTGDLFSFTFYLALLVAPIAQMANIGSQITEALAGLDRMNEMLSKELEEDDPRRTVELGRVSGDVSFESVGFEYEEGNPVLHDLSFEAPAGSVVALVGSSGSGKSTTAGLAATFRNPTKGRVLVDGIDLATVKLATYRNQLGLVLQDDFLFEGTVRDNVLFARPDATDDELHAAIVSANVHEFTDRFDDGLETVIGERGVKLSGGQRQRVAIARAILADPRILVLDEATSSLDTESEALIQESLERLMGGRTTFVIAHRLSTIRRADQILVIEDGRIVERGTHDELLAAEGRYHQLYTVQARI